MVSRQKALTKVFGDPQKRTLKRLQKRVGEVNALADKYHKMTATELKKQTDVLKKRLSNKKPHLIRCYQTPLRLCVKCPTGC